MWRSKKFIIVTVLAAVALVGSIGGVVLAADDGDNNGPAAKFGEFIDQVCEIYYKNTGDTINADELQKAVTEAQDEMQAAAMEARLAKMVENGVIDQTQAQELQEWWESRPDVPVGFGLMAPGGGRPFGGPHGGFGGWFGPPPPDGFEPPPSPE
jgi:hypothetical protein